MMQEKELRKLEGLAKLSVGSRDIWEAEQQLIKNYARGEQVDQLLKIYSI